MEHSPKPLKHCRQQRNAFRQTALAIPLQTRPHVKGDHAQILAGLSQQFFCQLANQFGIDTGDLIDLLADTLKIIVIARIAPGGLAITDWRKPGLPLRLT